MLKIGPDAIAYIESKTYRVFDKYDERALLDYAEYNELSPDDVAGHDWLDCFIEECMHCDEDTGRMELNDADMLPFAELSFPKKGFITYSWGGQSITKYCGGKNE